MIDLSGKCALIVGVANSHSIAAGCARMFQQAGAELAVTFLNEKAEPHVRSAVEALDPALILPLNVEDDSQVDAVFDAVRAQWGRLDILVHSVAFCPASDLHGRVVECSREGFARTMDVSCHSFLRLARQAEPLMAGNGGSMFTMTYYGANQVVENYGVMGAAKAALESVTRYLAAELGPAIRVHALSPGPMHTRAASGIKEFDALAEQAVQKSPGGALATADDVGAYAAFLASDLAAACTGNVTYIDRGYNIID